MFKHRQRLRRLCPQQRRQRALRGSSPRVGKGALPNGRVTAPISKQGDSKFMKAFETFETPTATRVNYMNADYGLKSWLLTKDHKRIALLYLGSISAFFFIGGSTHVHSARAADTARRLFSRPRLTTRCSRSTDHHDLFLLIRRDRPRSEIFWSNEYGAKDLAFPRINLLSWYIYLLAGLSRFRVAGRRVVRVGLFMLRTAQLFQTLM